MKQIREWLESKAQPYAPGVALYEAHGKSRVVLTALRRGESEFTRQKLREELTKLAQAVPAAAPPAKPAPLAPPRASRAPVTRPAGPAAPVAPPAPTSADVSEAVYRQRSSWYAERHRLHGQLELLPSDEERQVAGERILVISELLTASYQGTGEAATPAAAPRPDLSGVRDQGEIRRLLANLRPQASKLKKNPARALELQLVRADIKTLESNLLKP